MKPNGKLNGNRSPELLADLIEQNHAKLFRLAISIVHLQEDAKDVIQDASLQMFRNFSRFHEDSDFYTWAYRIVFNRVLDFLRKRKRILETQWEDGEVKNITGPDQIEELREKVEREYFAERILSSLSQKKKEVLELKYLGGLTEREIAEKLGVGVSAISSRVYRALREARGSSATKEVSKELRKRLRNDKPSFQKDTVEVLGANEKAKIARGILLSCSSAQCPVPIEICANGRHIRINASHISAFLMREMLRMDFDVIGLVLGDKRKAAAISAYRKVYKCMQQNRRLRMVVWNIKQKFSKILAEENKELIT